MDSPELATEALRKADLNRINSLLMGGDEHYQPDRVAAEELRQFEPRLADTVRQHTEFGFRVARLMMGLGITQLIDVGCGYATGPPLQVMHEVVWQANPDARILYVDNDPLVIGHLHARLPRDPRLDYLEADVRDVDAVLGSSLIDLSQPVGMLWLTLTHYLSDDDDPAGLIDAYSRRVAPGSFLALSNGNVDHFSPQDRQEAVAALERATLRQITFRTQREILKLLGGREMLPPGLVDVCEWRPDAAETPTTGRNLGAVVRLTPPRG